MIKYEHSAPFAVYAQDPEPTVACRVCGCHEMDACFHPEHGNCWWEEKDLCSHCKYWPGEATRYSLLETQSKSTTLQQHYS